MQTRLHTTKGHPGHSTHSLPLSGADLRMAKIFAAAIVYLMNDGGDPVQASPHPTPFTVSPGPGKMVRTVDGASLISRSGGNIVHTAGAGVEDPAYYWTDDAGAGFPRAVGLAYRLKKTLTANVWHLRGWVRSASANSGNLAGMFLSTPAVYNIWETSASSFTNLDSYAYGSEYQFAFVLKATGMWYFQKTPAGSWTLQGVTNSWTNTPMWPAFTDRGTAGTENEDKVWQLRAPFTTEYGIADINAAAPASASSHSPSSADNVIHFSFTLPGAPVALDKIEIRYRVQDASNYWTAYIERNAGNTAWDFKVDSVSGGVATNRVSAAGVGTPTGIQILVDTSSHRFSTCTGFGTTAEAWTTRGGLISVAHLNSTLPLSPVYVAGATAGNLRVYPRRSSNYSQLDEG